MDALLNLDNILYQWINTSLSNPVFDLILVPFRHKMFWIPLYLFILIFVRINFKRQSLYIYLFFGATILLSDGMSSQVIKKTVERTRPCHEQALSPIERVPCSNGFSFTSSHATNHFAIGSFLFFLFGFTQWRRLFLVWAGIIGFAQVYVGVHYPFDVIVGSIIGFLIGLLTFNVFKYLVGVPELSQTETV